MVEIKQINNISPVGTIYLAEQLGFKYIMPTAFMFVYSISTDILSLRDIKKTGIDYILNLY